jgi:hypothetical protein
LTIKNAVLQLQDSGPLPPEAIDVLSLGPKFAVMPKEVPKMQIIAEVEKVALPLERKKKKKKRRMNYVTRQPTFYFPPRRRNQI